MKAKLIFISFLVVFISCEETDIEPTNENTRADHPWYDFVINGGDEGSIHLVGDSLEGSIWKKDQGYIYLNTDKLLEDEPIGTLSFNIDSVFERNGGVLMANVKSAAVSKTNKREGTPQEMNGKTYFLDNDRSIDDSGQAGLIDSIVIGNNYISGKFNMAMTGGQAFEEPEQVIVTGWFLSVSNYDAVGK